MSIPDAYASLDRIKQAAQRIEQAAKDAWSPRTFFVWDEAVKIQNEVQALRAAFSRIPLPVVKQQQQPESYTLKAPTHEPAPGTRIGRWVSKTHVPGHSPLNPEEHPDA